jgi:hypothetical protein
MVEVRLVVLTKLESDRDDEVRLRLGKLKEDDPEKLVGVAELNPVPVGPELIEAFAGKLKEKLGELDTLEEDVWCA